MSRPTLQISDLGITEYTDVFARMRAFTDARDADTPDQLWLNQHHPVFTQGQAGKPEHVLFPGDIPIVQSDRGGQVTYHGPGQITAYFLFDLRRLKIGVKELVNGIEQVMIDTVGAFGIDAARLENAPGVYVAGSKIGSLGLRVRRGCSYHGLSLNVDMDVEPFARINPCGLLNMQVIDMVQLQTVSFATVQDELVRQVLKRFAFDHHMWSNRPAA
ncbi:MAG: lipoyl(octanoyl) transferase LipB [Pseudomonadota bacterium]